MSWETTEIVAASGVVVALLSFFRPEITKLFRAIFKKIDLEIIQSGFLEVGYGGILGPSLCIRGTLRPLNSKVFVKNIRVTIFELTSGTYRSFGWRLFREDDLTITGVVENESSKISLPRGFLIEEGYPHFFSITFNDDAVFDKIRTKLNALNAAWLRYTVEAQKNGNLPPLTGITPPNAQTINMFENLFISFAAEPFFIEAVQLLDESFYWKAGTYKAEMDVDLSNPARTFKKTWSYELSSEESDALKMNTWITIRNACGFKTIKQNFAYAKYL